MSNKKSKQRKTEDVYSERHIRRIIRQQTFNDFNEFVARFLVKIILPNLLQMLIHIVIVLIPNVMILQIFRCKLTMLIIIIWIF